jgi:hypothetical protein
MKVGGNQVEQPDRNNDVSRDNDDPGRHGQLPFPTFRNVEPLIALPDSICFCTMASTVPNG